jgi:GNAT superfamily N-acetyltransferase
MSAIVVLSTEDAQKVEVSLNNFNASAVPFTQSPPFVRLCFGLRTDDGLVAAGVNGLVNAWGILFVEAFWIDEPLRHQGLGTQLLARIESEARKLGCTLSHLDTFDFQAREFYERNGYELFGTLDECPPGHKRYYLKKTL